MKLNKIFSRVFGSNFQENIKNQSMYGKFCDDLYHLERSDLERDFEDFLLAFFNIIQPYKNEIPTFELILKLLHDSYTSESYPFNNEWLQITKPPKIDEIIDKEEKGFELLNEVLKFQIAELHRIKKNPPSPDDIMYGFRSETGNKWSNLHQIYNLRCGIRCMGDNSMDTNKVSWHYIALAFELGRIYE